MSAPRDDDEMALRFREVARELSHELFDLDLLMWPRGTEVDDDPGFVLGATLEDA